MARRIDYVIAVDDSQATAKVAAFEQRAMAAGTSTGGLATATRDLASAQSTLDKQTQSMVGTVTKYGSSVATAAEKSVDLVTGLDAQSRAVQATDKLLADLESRYPSVATSTVAMETATVAATGAVEGMSGAVFALMAGLEAWLVPAILVGEAINLIANYFADASLASETLAAKQDVVNKAFSMTGVVMGYADAIKYLNEQLARTNPLADHAAKAFESMKLAMAAGPTAAGIESLRLLAVAGKQVGDVLQQDLVRMGGDDGMSKALALLRQHTVAADAQFGEWAKTIGLSSTGIATLKDQVRAEDEATKHSTEVTKQATVEYERQQQAIQKLVDTANKQRGDLLAHVLGLDDVEKAERVLDVLHQYDDVTKLTVDRQKELGKLFDTAIDVMVKRGDEVPAELLLWAAALNAVLVPAARLGSLGGFSGIGPLLSNPLTLSSGEALPAQIPNIAASPGIKIGFSFSQAFESSAITGLNHLPRLLESALLHNGSTIQVVEGVGTDLGSALGSKVGATIGALGKFGGPIGAAVGSLVGPVIDMLAHIGGPSKQEVSGRQTESQFEQSFGGFTQMMQQLGVAYAATGHSAQEAQADVKGLLDAEKQGPAAVQAWIDKINQVRDAYALQDQALQDVNDAAQRYGITLEELGPALQKQNLDEQAMQLFKDWKLLTSAGVDQVVVIGHMKDAINDYVHQALKMGIEVPEAMRPVLQQMIDLGQLTDENGTIITDLSQSGIHFAETMTQGFQKVVDAVEKLATAIEQRLGLAIANLPDHTVHINTDYTTTGDPAPGSPGPYYGDPGIPSNYDGTPDYDGDPTNSMKFGGVGYAAGPRTFTTQGNEYYAFSGEGKSFQDWPAAGKSSQTPTQVTYNVTISATDARSFEQLMEERGVHVVVDSIVHGNYGHDRALRNKLGTTS